MKLALALVTVMSTAGPVQAETALAPSALNSYSRVPDRIMSAPVMDQSGAVIGKVTRVVGDHNGKPSAMTYTTTDGRLVMIAAPAVSYDGQRNLLITQDSPQRVASR